MKKKCKHTIEGCEEAPPLCKLTCKLIRESGNIIFHTISPFCLSPETCEYRENK